MQGSKWILGVFLLCASFGIAQKKQITLEDIWKGAFRTEYMDRLQSLNNGKEYVVLNYDRKARASTVDVYDYATSQKVRTLVNTQSLDGVDYIISYELSDDETKMLIATQLQSIYRRSTLGTYYVYDLDSESLELVADMPIQEPTFSPDGSKVAYGFNNNIYVKDLVGGETTEVTKDGKKNKIINGITDWVYEEEFGFVRAFDWNAAGTHIAFIRFDETEVPEFSMDVYGKDLYQSQQVFKYPKAGEANAKVSLHMYELSSGNKSNIDVTAYNSYYIPRIKWTKDPDVLSVQLTNRKQNTVDLVLVNTKDNSSKLVLQDTDDAYVDITDNLTFLANNSFIWTSEKDGWNHIYHYDKNGKLLNQVTDGEWEVTRYYGFDTKTGRIYYQSSERGSMYRDVYSILPSGKNKVQLTSRPGTNSASFSADFSYFINTFSSAMVPPVYTLHNALDGEKVREILNNTELRTKLLAYDMSPKEFSTINVNGNELNMYMIKPSDFDPEKKYPIFMYQYSGPGSQNVADRWGGSNDYWHQMLAQQDIIVVCVDGRGTGLKGRDFKKVTQLELGKYEVQDQIGAAQQLAELPYIDGDRIGIWGWSYGGFMSANCLFQGADTFSMAIAVAPVGSWRFYDTIYTERYMSTPQENPGGYDNNSPISHVDKLKGDFLLVHGTADDNVHVQNSTRLVEALVQANKQFDWAMYPDKNHGIYGGNTRLHLYTKMTNFILDNL
ncbi:S9 family peptidase [Gilvibacter sediminis]|uniref:S9 family peptidase n=1 Tax=Gilvibacter sediminis TaxID=379071 RepID=UPI00234FD921|nr:S9 family peptidase [Gilvibacter sediminis]MDC7997391.1 S9 family peptidase [Gilvibacter sediminis]